MMRRPLPCLSLHFLAAQDWERTWRYARMAARVAEAAHAPGEEAVHLQRAITSARRLGDVDADELATVFSDLGRSLELLGEYERADDAYRHGDGGMAVRSAAPSPDRLSQGASAERVPRATLLRHPTAASGRGRAGRQ